MKTFKLILLSSFVSILCSAQTNPAITRWLQNTTVMGRHYVSGNSTPIQDNIIANVQTVRYSSSWVYINTNGIPTYVTGPFLDGNPSLATSQNAIFKFPLSPAQNTGTPTATNGGNIGVFINGVALFDYRDGVSWKCSTNSLAGGPLGGTGDGVWNRDAVVAEKGGFDCSKGHPAMGNYHHHQNPSAFKLDLNVISTVCNLYNADGLYAIDSTKHSPLLGFAFDGFPIYGAYGYKNTDGTGGIVRMKSSYEKRNITTRTTYANGTTVSCGPAVSTTYPLGYFREDYQYVAHAGASDYLDEHNGRFCITPEYPNGTYCYFATVEANWNSAYPYVVGPTFYGNKTAAKVTSITETVTTYPPNTTPSIYIAASAREICAGTLVTFTSAIYNGGLSPSYQWKKNGMNVGTGSTYSSSSLANGDVITCVLTTASSATATSNSVTMVVNCQNAAVLNLNAFIEGFYAGNQSMRPVLFNAGLTTNPTISDSITVELHSALSPYSLVETTTGILNTNGTCTVEFSSSRISNSYYIVLRHRNSIETWSSVPVLFSATTSYNFTGSQSSAYGSNLVRTPDNLYWSVFSGDISDVSSGVNHQDQLIESQDFLDMENAVSNILSGYVVQDLTGDGVVESEDFLIVENNVRMIVFGLRP